MTRRRDASEDEERTLCVYHAKVLRETDKALKVEIDGQAAWLPKSQIHKESDVAVEGDEGTLYIPEWLARAKDLAVTG